MSDEWYRTVARVGEITEGVGHAVEVEGRPVAVFLVDGAYYAIDDVCPHQEFPLNDGIVFDCSVTCLYHGWRFRLDDGRLENNARIRVGTYPVRVVGDEIQVAVDPDE